MAASVNLTPAERRLRAQVAANARWAKTDRRLESERARERQFRRFEEQVDPDGTLPPDELWKRAENARKAHMSALALKSAKARRERAAASRGAA